MNQLRDLDAQFVIGCRKWFLLRLWEECGSFDSSSVENRIRIAGDILAEPHRGDLTWAITGQFKLVDHLIRRLDDHDPLIRQEAAVALADLDSQARRAVPVFLDRLRSSTISFHDRSLAAWALPRIGAESDEVVPVLLAAINSTAGLEEADGLRRCAAESVIGLVEPFAYRVLVPLARLCLRDQAVKCRLIGLGLTEDLLKRTARLRQMLVPFVEPLLDDEVAEVRAAAERIVNGFGENVSQS